MGEPPPSFRAEWSEDPESRRRWIPAFAGMTNGRAVLPSFRAEWSEDPESRPALDSRLRGNDEWESHPRHSGLSGAKTRNPGGAGFPLSRERRTGEPSSRHSGLSGILLVFLKEENPPRNQRPSENPRILQEMRINRMSTIGKSAPELKPCPESWKTTHPLATASSF